MSTNDQAANSTPSSPVDPGPDFLVVPDPTAFGERRGSKVRVSTFIYFYKFIFTILFPIFHSQSLQFKLSMVGYLSLNEV